MSGPRSSSYAPPGISHRAAVAGRILWKNEPSSFDMAALSGATLMCDTGGEDEVWLSYLYESMKALRDSAALRVRAS